MEDMNKGIEGSEEFFAVTGNKEQHAAEYDDMSDEEFDDMLKKAGADYPDFEKAAGYTAKGAAAFETKLLRKLRQAVDAYDKTHDVPLTNSDRGVKAKTLVTAAYDWITSLKDDELRTAMLVMVECQVEKASVSFAQTMRIKKALESGKLGIRDIMDLMGMGM